jgi:hypothetical protein
LDVGLKSPLCKKGMVERMVEKIHEKPCIRYWMEEDHTSDGKTTLGQAPHCC